MLETDPDEGPRRSPACTCATYLGLPNYTNNWKRLGFTDDDIADGGSDRLVDALVVWGDEDAIAARVQAHRDAGADHVCVQVLTDRRRRRFPLERVAPPRRLDADIGAGRSSGDLRVRPLPALRRAGRVAARAGRRPPDLVTVESYGRSHEGRDLWLVTVTDAATGRHDTKPAHWVDASIHAVELTATVAACCLLQHLVNGYARRRPGRHRGAARPARSTSCRGSTPTAPSGRSPTGPASAARARGRGRGPTPTAGRALHVEDVDGDGRDPADAHRRSRRGVDAAPGGRPAAGPRAARRRAGRRRPATGCSTRARSSTTTGSPSRRRARPRASTSTATSPPAGSPASAAPATTRCPSPRSTPSCGPSSPAPTSAGTTRSTPAAACCCGRRRPSADSALPPVDLWAWKQLGRARHGADRVPRALRVRGLHVGQVRHDERRRRRLGLRAPRRVLVDDRVLGRRPRRDRHASRRPTSGTSVRRTSRRWPCCGGSTSTPPTSSSTGTRSTTPSSGRSSSGAGTPRASGRTRRRRCCAAEVAPHADVRRRPGAGVAVPGGPPHAGRRRSAAASWRVEVGIANTGWLPTDVSTRAARTTSCCPLVAELVGDGRAVVGGPARRALGQLEGRAGMRFTPLAPTARPTGRWRRGSSRARPDRPSSSSPATRGPGRSAWR